MPLSKASRLGPYRILAPLGAGGMGEVYRARDTRLDRDVALKVLPPDLAGDAMRQRRFEQEARTMAALNHPNVATVYDVGAEGGIAFLVTELVDGESLRAILDRGALPVRTAIDIAGQVAQGLAAAHAGGIIHRDLKPAGEPRSIPGAAPGEQPIGWAAGGRAIYVYQPQGLPVHVYRVDVTTGKARNGARIHAFPSDGRVPGARPGALRRRADRRVRVSADYLRSANPTTGSTRLISVTPTRKATGIVRPMLMKTGV